MPAMAIDQDAAQPHLTHLAKGDLHGPAGSMGGRVASSRMRHAAIQRGIASTSQIILVARDSRELLPLVGMDGAECPAPPR